MNNIWCKRYFWDKKPNNKFMRKLLEDFITNSNVNFWTIIITIRWPKDEYNVDN